MHTEATSNASMKRCRHRRIVGLEAEIAGGTLGLDAIDKMGRVHCGIETRSRTILQIDVVVIGSTSHCFRRTKGKAQ